MRPFRDTILKTILSKGRLPDTDEYLSGFMGRLGKVYGPPQALFGERSKEIEEPKLFGIPIGKIV